jgi:carbon-monoxide dehydrogenase medium subunit
MSGLAYAAPASVAEAIRALAGAKGSTKFMAGGTDLLVQLRSGRVSPGLILDTKAIPGMIGVTETADGFAIGAATPCAALAEHAGLVACWPGLVEASSLIGSTQVQGRASLAGNLCNASPAADSVPAMIAAQAIAVVVGPDGERQVPVEAVVTAPGRISLAPHEFIVRFLVKRPPARSGDAYLRFIPRTEMDIAVVGAGIAVTLDAAGVCVAARVSLGAVAPTPLLVPDAAAALVGHKLDDATLARLDAAARAVCRPIDDKRGTIEFRTKIAGVLARRAAAIAFARAAGEKA